MVFPKKLYPWEPISLSINHWPIKLIGSEKTREISQRLIPSLTQGRSHWTVSSTHYLTMHQILKSRPALELPPPLFTWLLDIFDYLEFNIPKANLSSSPKAVLLSVYFIYKWHHNLPIIYSISNRNFRFTLNFTFSCTPGIQLVSLFNYLIKCIPTFLSSLPSPYFRGHVPRVPCISSCYNISVLFSKFIVLSH